MKYDPHTHHRHSIRIPGFDYTRHGTYFITVATKSGEDLFGMINQGVMLGNGLAKIVQEEWERTAVFRPGVRLDAFIVMPDHIHGLITILADGGGLTTNTRRVVEDSVAEDLAKLKIDGPHGPARGSIGAIVGQFKSITTKRINSVRQTPGMPVWQRNYFERIIRDEQDYQNTVNYILNNPMNWDAGKND